MKTSDVKAAFLMVALSIAVAITGCKKAEVGHSPSYGESKLAGNEKIAGAFAWNNQLVADVDPSNPNNPFDYFGQQHNEGLTEVDQLMQAGGDDSKEAKREVFLQYVKEKRGIDARERFTNLEELMERAEQNMDFIYELAEANARPYLVKINSLTDGLNSADSYAHYISGIKELEAVILSDPELSDESRNMLLIGTSVGRHSANWWYHQINRTPDYQEGKGFFHGFLRFHAYVHGDLFAAVTKFLTGGSGEEIIDDAVGISEFFSWYVDCNWFPGSPRAGKF